METTEPIKNKRFTILLVPSPSDRIRRFDISGRWIRWGTFAGIAFAVIVAVFSALSVVLFEKEARMIALQHKSRAQKEEIVRIYRKLQDVRSKMVDVAKLERKVRLIMNTAESNSSNVVLGLGGPTQTVAPSVLIQKGKQGMEDLMSEMDRQIGDLGQGILNQEESLANLKHAIKERQTEWAFTPSIWPTRGVLTSRFGYRTSPFGLGRDFHLESTLPARSAPPSWPPPPAPSHWLAGIRALEKLWSSSIQAASRPFMVTSKRSPSTRESRSREATSSAILETRASPPVPTFTIRSWSTILRSTRSVTS